MENNNICGWVKLFHPGGVQVTLPVPVTHVVDQETAGIMLASVSAYLQAGWLANMPGLEEGETKEKITHLVRREKTNDDGSKTPLIDVYCGGNFRTLGVYLNTQDDIAEFEKCFGPLAKFPVYDGDVPIERGKKPDRDKLYVISVSGVNVVWKLNPKYEGEEDKKNPKRLFVRWENGGASSVPHTPVVSAAPAQSAPVAAPPAPVAAPPAPVTAPTAPVRAYLNGERVNGNEAEQKAFDSYLATHGKAPESKEALRQWVKNGR